MLPGATKAGALSPKGIGSNGPVTHSKGWPGFSNREMPMPSKPSGFTPRLSKSPFRKAHSECCHMKKIMNAIVRAITGPRAKWNTNERLPQGVLLHWSTVRVLQFVKKYPRLAGWGHRALFAVTRPGEGYHPTHSVTLRGVNYYTAGQTRGVDGKWKYTWSHSVVVRACWQGQLYFV
jgi:hypothetical protein